jgi:predicted transcriptional regulator
MQQSKREYTIFEKKILVFLYNSRIERSTGEIARKLDMSWATANKYLNILLDECQLINRKEGNRVYWMYWTQFMDLPDGEKEKWG